MKSIGVRAEPSSVTFSVFCSKTSSIITLEKIKIPKALATPQGLKHLRTNFIDVLNEFSIETAGLRITESVAQRPNRDRMGLEAVIQETLASSNLRAYFCGQIANITSKLDIDRKMFKPYAEGNEVFMEIDGWKAMSLVERESILTAVAASNV
jgi:hypothetical protein